jgi:hypothetical protein
VQIIGDTVPEMDETFTVELGSPIGAVLGRRLATGTILDDDTGTIGGRDLRVTSLRSHVHLSWTGGKQQLGYAILRKGVFSDVVDILPRPGILLPAERTFFSDPAAPPGEINCYAVIPMGNAGPLGSSDTECSLRGVAGGVLQPFSISVTLHGSQNATLDWVPPDGGADAYLLLIVPVDGTPASTQVLPGSQTTIVVPIGTVPACFQVFAYRGAEAGSSEAVCGLPAVRDSAH